MTKFLNSLFDKTLERKEKEKKLKFIKEVEAVIGFKISGKKSFKSALCYILNSCDHSFVTVGELDTLSYNKRIDVCTTCGVVECNSDLVVIIDAMRRNRVKFYLYKRDGR